MSGDSISVAFEFISASFSSSLGYNTRIAPSRAMRSLTRNNLQNQLDLIYRTSLKFTKMEREFIITIFSENKVGILSQVTTVFTHRNVNIESIAASPSAIEGIHKYTIMVKNDPERVANLVKQIEKKVDVLKVFCYSPSEVVLQQLALYKVKRSRNVEDMVRRHNVRILEIHDEYIVLEKTGHKDEIDELYHMLAPHGIYQFVCSGQVAIIKSRRELLDEYLKYVNEKRDRMMREENKN